MGVFTTALDNVLVTCVADVQYISVFTTTCSLFSFVSCYYIGVHRRKKRRHKPKSSSRSHDRHVRPVEDKSRDRHVAVIEESDGESSDSKSSELEEEEEEEEERREKSEVFLRKSKEGGVVEQIDASDAEPSEGEAEEKRGSVKELAAWSDAGGGSDGLWTTERETAESLAVLDLLVSPERGNGGGEGQGEEYVGGGEMVEAGEGEREEEVVEEDSEALWTEDGADLAYQIEGSPQEDVENDTQKYRQNLVFGSNSETQVSAVAVEDEKEEREPEEEEEREEDELEPTTVEREPEVVESRLSQSPSSRPAVVSPDQFGTRSPLQSPSLMNQKFPDALCGQTSKNPFDLLEQDFIGDHTHSRLEEEEHRERGRNPFDDSPNTSPDLAPPTTDSAQNGLLPALSNQLSHPQITTSNPFDSARDTPSPPLTSPTSSDFLGGETPSLAGHQEEERGGGGGGRVLRSDSLEWSLYMEQNMVDLPGGGALSELALEEDHYSAEVCT